MSSHLLIAVLAAVLLLLAGHVVGGALINDNIIPSSALPPDIATTATEADLVCPVGWARVPYPTTTTEQQQQQQHTCIRVFSNPIDIVPPLDTTTLCGAAFTLYPPRVPASSSSLSATALAAAAASATSSDSNNHNEAGSVAATRGDGDATTSSISSAAHLVINGKNYTYAYAKATPMPVSVRCATDNEAIRRLFATALQSSSSSSSSVVSLGGVAGFGDIYWFDKSPSLSSLSSLSTSMEVRNNSIDRALTASVSAATEEESTGNGGGGVYTGFTNFAVDDTEWLTGTVCIGMRVADGVWTALPCRTGEGVPYACAFPLTTDLVTVMPEGKDDNSNSNDDSSSDEGEKPVTPTYARRRPVPEPVPECLPGWTPVPPLDTATTTTQQQGALCYRVYSPAAEVGAYGKTFAAANTYCAGKHPRGSLASVFTPDENAFILREMILQDPRLAGIATIHNSGGSTATSSSPLRRTVVFLGGNYMSVGTSSSGSAVLDGSWAGDVHQFTEADRNASAPSSPAWPTAANGFFSNWAAGQPRLSYGCVAMAFSDMTFTTPSSTATHAAAGQWVSEDCRSTQPFICTYRNDGSSFPPTTTVPPQPSDDSSDDGEINQGGCANGWWLHTLTDKCYTVRLSTATSTTAGGVWPDVLEDHCGHELDGIAENPDKVHSAVITSAEESAFAGLLLGRLTTTIGGESSSSLSLSSSSSSSLLSIVGVSFIDRGAAGLYLDGVTNWHPHLAESLWAVGEPAEEKGCVAVDAQGWWHHAPCGRSSSSGVAAYACQYRLDEVILKDDPGTTSTTPGPSTDSPAPTPSPMPEPGDTVPLSERIASFSGAVHLIVSAGTIGVYTVDSRGRESTEGLLFYFAPVSPFYTHPESAATAIPGLSGSNNNALPVYSPFGALLFDGQRYAPCGAGAKKQEELVNALLGKLTVNHGRRRMAAALDDDDDASMFVNEVGYVCVSENGRDYVPTRITYEVVAASLGGLVPIASRNRVTTATTTTTTNDSKNNGGGLVTTTSAQTVYLPPLFHSASDAATAASDSIAIERHASGFLQLGLRRNSDNTTSSTFRLPGSTKGTTTATAEQSYIDSIRLAATADCMDAEYSLLARDLAVIDVSRYQQRTNDNNASSSSAIYAISYQWADIAVRNLSRLSRLDDPTLTNAIPREFYVCVSVRKRPAATAALLALWNASYFNAGLPASHNDSTSEDYNQYYYYSTAGSTSHNSGDKALYDFTNASQPLDAPFSNRVAMRRLLAASSVAAPRNTTTASNNTSMMDSGETRVYTVVPGLRVHFVEPPVALRGMWAVPPQPMQRASFRAEMPLSPLVTGSNNSSSTAGVRPRLLLNSSPLTAGSVYTASSTAIRVPQYSSPVLVLDGEGLEEGMSLLLSRIDDGGNGNGCSRHQLVSRSGGNSNNGNNPDLPSSLDTMIPISVLTVPVDVVTSDINNTTTVVRRHKKVAFAQLNLNVTGMWGGSTTGNRNNEDDTQSWRVCFSYSTTGEFVPVKPLKVIVTRMHIATITAVTAAGVSETSNDLDAHHSSNSSSRADFNANVGFTGLWQLWGLDVRMWSATTLHNAQIALSKALPDGSDYASGSGYLTSAQCASPALFYRQQHGLGLTAPPPVSSGVALTSGGGSSLGLDDDAYAGLVIPPGYLSDVSVRRMRVCLSVPLPFRATRRVFLPTAATVDVRPIQILYIGRYAAAATTTSASTTALASSSTPDLTTTTTSTLLRVAEDADDVVFPLIGYGLCPDMMLFLSRDADCRGGSDGGLVARQSHFNISLVAPHDLPANYWALRDNNSNDNTTTSTTTASAATPHVYMVIGRETLTGRAVADATFGADRSPLNICLYAPGTRGDDTTTAVVAAGVHRTDFSLVVLPPSVGSVDNMADKDRELIALAMGNRTFHEDNTITNTNSSSYDAFDDAHAIVVYAGYTDLLVDGFGILESQTEFIPALDCANASSFLWEAPVGLSPIPSSRGREFFATAERYVDPQTSQSSWFLPISQAESARFGATDPWGHDEEETEEEREGTNSLVSRFTWCVRYRKRDAYVNVSSSTEDGAGTASLLPSSSSGNQVNINNSTWHMKYDWTHGFVSTGLPFHLVLPRIDGFRFGNTISQLVTLPVQHPELGQWQRIQLVGPLVDITFTLGNPLYMFLAPESSRCSDVKNDLLASGTLESNIVLAVNGSAVIMPHCMAAPGVFKFCASAVLPDVRSIDDNVDDGGRLESTLQFFSLPRLRLELFEPVYAVFALNHTSNVLVEQGSEWTLPLSGSQLSNYTLVRFQPRGVDCGEPVTSHLGEPLADISVRNAFVGFNLFNIDETIGIDNASSSTTTTMTRSIPSQQYIMLERAFVRALSAPATYQLCFKANRATPWASSAVTLRVAEHVRQPTRYNYFAADGSEDVVAVRALAPAKVALEWLTGERDTDNVVGALGREVVLAMHCLQRPDNNTMPSDDSSSASSSSSSNDCSSASSSSEEDATAEKPQADRTAPCGDHRRVMFVKPLDDDADPCFVDAEAVTDTIIRGPYVIDYGILTVPGGVSGVDVGFYPNMTQAWVMCLETRPERWREPIYPLLKLQYTAPIPVGFRNEADDPSNTTATFPGSSNNTVSGGGDRMDYEGNTTLTLHTGDSSQVYYLNGYGIQRGFRLRFGARCDEDSTAADLLAAEGIDAANATAIDAFVSLRQELTNPLLYTAPLAIEDDHGVFLVPRAHLAVGVEARLLPVCLGTVNKMHSSHNSHSDVFVRTTLSLAVLPSRLKRDVPSMEQHLIQRVLGDTLVVPRGAVGSVNVTDLAARAVEKRQQANNKEKEEDGATPSPFFFPAGTEVILSSSCVRNREGLPAITVSAPNVLTLTAQHTKEATAGPRLHLCAKFPPPSTATPEATTTTIAPGDAFPSGGVIHEVNGTDSDDGNSGPQPVTGFEDTGLYFTVLAVSVGSVSVHEWLPSAPVMANSINQLVMRRGVADMLLSVALHTNGSSSSTTNSGNSALDTVCGSGSGGAVSEDCIKEVFLSMLSAPGALPFFSLARFRIGAPCGGIPPDTGDIDAHTGLPPTSAASSSWFSASTVVSPYAVKASFNNRTLDVAGLYSGGSVGVGLVAPFPYLDDESAAKVYYPPWAPASLCLSVDGGRHYLSVGIAYFTADWAPTLRARLNPTDGNAATGTAGNSSGLFTDSIRVFEQTSVYAKLSDTRYDYALYDNTTSTTASSGGGVVVPPFNDTPAQTYLNRFTMDALWTGFLGNGGLASQGVLYLPSTLARATATTTTGGIETTTRALSFYPSSHFTDWSGHSGDENAEEAAGRPTGLSLTVEPFHLSCFGADDAHAVPSEYVRRGDNGRLLPIAAVCGGRGIPEGTTLRLVDDNNGTLTAAAACTAPSVHTGGVFALDAAVVRPFLWAPAGSSTAASYPSPTAPGNDNNPSREAAAARLQLPPALRYLPDGVYHVCVKKYRWSTAAASRLREAAVFIPAAPGVQLIVTGNLTVARVAGATNGIVSLYQGSNAAVPVEGTAVMGRRGPPVLMALAPVVPINVTLRGETNSSARRVVALRRGCLDVPMMRDPVTGESLVVSTATTALSADAQMLTAVPWLNAQDGLWRLPAAYLRHFTNQSLYFLCSSIDNGVTFDFVENAIEPASLYGENDEEEVAEENRRGPTPHAITIAVRSPTVIGFAQDPSGGGVVDPGMYVSEAVAGKMRFDPGWTSSSALRIHRLTSTALPLATTATFASGPASSPAGDVLSAVFSLPSGQPAAVQLSHYANSNSSEALLSRVASYFYHPTSAFIGDGIGASSFREYWPSSSNDGTTTTTTTNAVDDTHNGFFTPSAEARPDYTDAADVTGHVPSVAAAIAIIRSSVYGQICSGPLPNHNVSIGIPTTTATTTTTSTGSNGGTMARTGVLAMPVFLLDLRTGGVWSPAADAAYDADLAALNATAPGAAAAAQAMNPVLARADFRDNTAALWRLYGGGGTSGDSGGGGVINIQSILAMATTAAEANGERITGEGLVVCASIDGVYFLSANAHVLPPVAALEAQAFAAVAGVESKSARMALRVRRLAVSGPRNRPAPFVDTSPVPMILRAEPPALTIASSSSTTTPATLLGSWYMRDLSLRTALVIRPNLTATLAALTRNSSSSSAKAALAALTAEQWRTALSVRPSPRMIANFVDSLSQAVGVEAAVLVVSLQPTGTVAVPSTDGDNTPAIRQRAMHRVASGSSGGGGDVSSADETTTTPTTTTTTTAAPGSNVPSLHLPTYNLLISVAADAHFINVTGDLARTLMAAPDILLRAVEVLRGNATQFTLLRPLLYPQANTTTTTVHDNDDDVVVAAARASAYASSIAMNFTFANGFDISRVVTGAAPSATAAASHLLTVGPGVNVTLPAKPLREGHWRTAFMAIPFDTVAPVPIPADPNNDTSAKVTWWVIPLLLIFPFLTIVGSYYVYKHVIKPQAGAATEVTVEGTTATTAAAAPTPTPAA